MRENAMDAHAAERLAIREIVENWVVWRDAGDWERFQGVWHSDGRMMATWFQWPAQEFIRLSRAAFENGVNIQHFLGGNATDLAGDRAISQTKMTITQRAVVHAEPCDVVCTGRFYDFFEKRNGRWGIVLRQPIYERDRIDPVDPGARLSLEPALARAIPRGLSPSRLSADTDWLSSEVRDAGLEGPAARTPLRTGPPPAAA